MHAAAPNAADSPLASPQAAPMFDEPRLPQGELWVARGRQCACVLSEALKLRSLGEIIQVRLKLPWECDDAPN